MNAGLRVQTVCMRCTAMRQYAARSYRISRGARRTCAAIRSVEIDAFGARMTRFVVAFVDVKAVFRTGDESVAASGEINYVS